MKNKKGKDFTITEEGYVNSAMRKKLVEIKAKRKSKNGRK